MVGNCARLLVNDRQRSRGGEIKRGFRSSSSYLVSFPILVFSFITVFLVCDSCPYFSTLPYNFLLFSSSFSLSSLPFPSLLVSSVIILPIFLLSLFLLHSPCPFRCSWLSHDYVENRRWRFLHDLSRGRQVEPTQRGVFSPFEDAAHSKALCQNFPLGNKSLIRVTFQSFMEWTQLR